MLLIIFFVQLTSLVRAQSLEGLANGEHSFKKLGPQFYVPCKTRRISDAKVLFFNQELAMRLGIDFPSNRSELERKLVETFSIFIKECGEHLSRDPEARYFASFYQDSQEKGEGDARGDGRALWIGELTANNQAGKGLAMDVVIKGVGKTPLAWEKHTSASHKDGLQSLQEGVHSYVVGRINRQNGLEMPEDLVVLWLPSLIKEDEKTGMDLPSTLTVRVGPQTRMGHLSYFSDDLKSFDKLMTYVARRALGIPSTSTTSASSLSSREFKEYVQLFTANLAHEAAQFYLLHALHGSPTRGNRTTFGTSIDNGTFQYLNGHHGDYPYMDGKFTYGEQVKEIRNYLLDLFSYMKFVQYRPSDMTEKGMEELKDDMLSLFDLQWDRETAEGLLERLGADRELAGKLIQCPPWKAIADGIRKLWELPSNREIRSEEHQKSFYPQAYNVRHFLSQIPHFLKCENLGFDESDWEGYEDQLFRSWFGNGSNGKGQDHESFGVSEGDFCNSIQQSREKATGHHLFSLMKMIQSGLAKHGALELQQWIDRSKKNYHHRSPRPTRQLIWEALGGVEILNSSWEERERKIEDVLRAFH